MGIFKVWFQYEEQGMGGFSRKFEAHDADEAQRLAREYAANERAKQQGNFLPVYVEPAFSLTDKDLTA